MSVQEVPRRDGSRKLLALDGGGIRGLISVEVLAAIEDQLRGDRGDDFRLSDEFDYVAGTSTGAVIATCVALGMTVKQIRDFYPGQRPGDVRQGQPAAPVPEQVGVPVVSSTKTTTTNRDLVWGRCRLPMDNGWRAAGLSDHQPSHPAGP